MTGSRYAFGVLCQRLVLYGYFCLTIDLPQHAINPQKLTLSEISETIMEGILVLRKVYGMRRIAVLGHSLGAVGVLFANAGYNESIERQIFEIWEATARLVEQLGEIVGNKRIPIEKVNAINQQIEQNYSQLKQLVFDTLRKGIEQNLGVSCYILLAPPPRTRAVLPGLSLLRHLRHSWLKKMIEEFHKRAIEQLYKEGNPANYLEEKDPQYINLQMFKTKEPYEFIEYLLNLKEPTDFLKLVEDIIRFKHRDGKTTFFEYYQKKYLLAKPKLFVYGTNDWLLRPFFPFRAARIEEFYKSCGNAEVYHHYFSHIMVDNPKQHVGYITAKDEWVTELIFEFLDKNL